MFKALTLQKIPYFTHDLVIQLYPEHLTITVPPANNQ
jgi:hypothetical protein